MSVHRWRLVVELDAFDDLPDASVERLELVIRSFMVALFPLGVRDVDLYDMTEIAERAGVPFA